MSYRPLQVLPCKNSHRGVEQYRVVSETNRRKQYLVTRIVRNGLRLWFCDCKTYAARHLPHLFTNIVSGCKHVRRVKKAA